MTTFTLWDLDDANLIGTYDSEPEALDVVRRSVATHGRESMLTVGLGRDGEKGQTVAVAEGEELIALAEQDELGVADIDQAGTPTEDPTVVGSPTSRATDRVA